MTATPITTAPAEAAPARKALKGMSVGEGQGRANWVVRLVMALLALLWVLPTFGVFVTSFRSLDDANASGWWTALLPSNWSRWGLGNYHDALTQANIGQGFINSVAITLPATFIPILIAAFAAYAFTFMEFRGKDVLFIAIVAMLVVPNYVALVPIQRLYIALHLQGQFAAVWLAHIGFGMSLAVYLLRNYMTTLPREVIESAKIDGASHFQTFWRLVLPMSTPALAAFAIFQFLWVWNDLFIALVFLGPGENEPITVTVNHLLSDKGLGWNLVTAGGFISLVVPVLVFLSMQRYFVRGLTAGSVKG
jgi:alpha-glucoside transport system permease protein